MKHIAMLLLLSTTMIVRAAAQEPDAGDAQSHAPSVSENPDAATRGPTAIDPTEDFRAMVVSLVSGVGMIFVGLAAVLFWWQRTRVALRWFWVGAAVWAVGVTFKFAWAIPLNGPILKAMKSGLPEAVFVPLGSIYIGSLTGVFEIGITLAAALIWKSMARSSACGVAVGVGAGAFEAILLAALSLLPAVISYIIGGELREQYLKAVAGVTHATPLVVLLSPTERVIALLGHVSSRTLVLWGVARGHWFWPFVGAFVLLSAVDTVAGYVDLAGLMGKINVWWVELALAPFAVISVPITVWCVRHWPSAGNMGTHAIASGETSSARV